MERFSAAITRPALTSALLRASAIAHCLGQLHHRGETHYALCPGNVIDAGADRIELARAQAMPLSHMSPEQTGRMNRRMDYRSDYYSLGVMLYEMLTGRLPFDADDRLELVHAHIARLPVDPCQIADDIPGTVGAIALKLLAKNGEDRYQSGSGLLTDLERCLTSLQETDDIPEFALGANDHSERLQVSHKLYGREAEIGKLMAVFERVAHSGSELLLVTGYSGVGKSSLVKEIHKPVVARRGYFAEGKFDQLNRNVPYVAIGQAFRDLIRQLLAESDAQIVAWRSRLLEALGPNGKVLTDVLPELTHLIGPQPDVPVLGPIEAQNRLNYVVLNFVRVFAKPEHPLVLFLDDLQWVDAASLNLLSAILAAADKPCLLVIGAYRDNEVAPGASLLATVEEIAKFCPVIRIEVKPLTEEHVTELVADTVKADRSAVASLAHLIYRKTLGNPFFIGQLLASLYHEKLLTLQAGLWRWDIAQIEARNISDDVVELLTREVQRLPPSTQHLLTLAACIGIRFRLAILSIIAQQEVAELQTQLRPAVVAGLLLDSSLAGRSASSYRFLHDRVQQAAYACMDEAAAKRTHLSIARLLFKQLSESEGSVFDVANQFSKALDLIDNIEERLALARLYLKTAWHAKHNSAFSLALQYADAGVQMLREDFWESQFEMCFELSLEHMEALLLNQRFAEVEEYIGNLLDRPLNDVQTVNVYGLQVRSLILQLRWTEAAELGLRVLAMFGAGINPRLGKLGIWIGVMRMHLLMAGRKPADLIELPLLSDPLKEALIQIFTPIIEATHFATPQLLPFLFLKQAYLAVRDGFSIHCPNAILGYGIVLIESGLGNSEESYEYGRISLELQRKHGGTLDYILCIFHGFVAHWKDHLASSREPLMEAYRLALEKGEFSHASYSVATAIWAFLLTGEPLSSVQQKTYDALEVMASLKHAEIVIFLAAIYNYVAKLVGVEPWKEQDVESLLSSEKSSFMLFNYYHCETLHHYLFNDSRAAIEAARQAQKHQDAAFGYNTTATMNFYTSLSLLSCYSDLSGGEAIQALPKVGTLQKQMKKWAQHAPMNYQHKWHLVEAERYRVLGKPIQAADHYDLAIAGAKEHKYVNEEALANELAGAFYLGLDKITVARAYLEEAHAKYQQWGAFAKVRQLEGRYPELLTRVATHAPETAAPSESRPQPQPAAEASIDINTLVKAAQTLSGEIQFSRLLGKLMRLLTENAGADQGALLLEREGTLRLQASVVADDIQVLQDLPLDAADMLSPAIVNYVRHTGELMALTDAAEDQRFAQDAHLARTHPKSVLCLPLLKQSRLIGILYLENRLTADVFSAERCELLHMLSAQIAISLENAQLYGALEHKVALRTRDLSQANQELKLTLEHLEASENRYLALFRDASDAIAIVDQKGNLEETNCRFAELFDYEQQELRGMSIGQIHPAAELTKIREYFSLVFGKGPVLPLSTSIVRQDGQAVEVEIRPAQIEIGGRKVLQGTYIDLTERKRQEQQRLATEKAHRNALVREVHHRIKNNLQSVSGLLESELGKFLELDPRLETAISQVNAIAMVHGLQGSDADEAIHLYDSVAKICKSVADLAQRPVLFQVEPEDAVIRRIEIEKDEAVSLALVLNELILNAVKHSPVDTPAPAVSLSARGDTAQLLIRNATATAPDFDIASGKGIGTGLDLVRSLLPEQGAELSFERDREGYLLTHLGLTVPVVAAIHQEERV